MSRLVEPELPCDTLYGASELHTARLRRASEAAGDFCPLKAVTAEVGESPFFQAQGLLDSLQEFLGADHLTRGVSRGDDRAETARTGIVDTPPITSLAELVPGCRRDLVEDQLRRER